MLTDYLGRHVSYLLESQPFSGWKFEITVTWDSPKREVLYSFKGRSFELKCREDDAVVAIFLHSGVDESLFVVPFATTRKEVLARFGEPERSGAPSESQYLGSHGAWDRFEQAGCFVHVQYKVDADAIEMITLMHPDAAPR